uniref:RING-type domain-containing protein n=1 Tax=Parascaris univalens TaxID=6257 RepID=A0A915AJN2_PARUN
MAPARRLTTRGSRNGRVRAASPNRRIHRVNADEVDASGGGAQILDDVEVLEVKPPAEKGSEANPIVLGIDNPAPQMEEKIDEGTHSRDRTNAATHDSASLSRRLAEALECLICKEIIYKCATICPCGHKFCAGCISLWMAANMTCPVCRRDMIAPIRDCIFDSVVEVFLQHNPGMRRTNEDREYLDNVDVITHMLPWGRRQVGGGGRGGRGARVARGRVRGGAVARRN